MIISVFMLFMGFVVLHFRNLDQQSPSEEIKFASCFYWQKTLEFLNVCCWLSSVIRRRRGKGPQVCFPTKGICYILTPSQCRNLTKFIKVFLSCCDCIFVGFRLTDESLEKYLPEIFWENSCSENFEKFYENVRNRENYTQQLRIIRIRNSFARSSEVTLEDFCNRPFCRICLKFRYKNFLGQFQTAA